MHCKIKIRTLRMEAESLTHNDMNQLIKLQLQTVFSYSTYCRGVILHRKQIPGPRRRSAARERSHAQAAIDFEAAPAEQLVLEDEAHRVRDLLGLPEPPERYGRGHPRERFGLHALDHRGTNETGCDSADPDAIARQLLRPHHGHRRHARLDC